MAVVHAFVAPDLERLGALGQKPHNGEIARVHFTAPGSEDAVRAFLREQRLPPASTDLAVVSVVAEALPMLRDDPDALAFLRDCTGPDGFRRFLTEWVFLSEGGAPSTLGSSLWPSQEIFLDAIREHPWVYFLKARQLGEAPFAGACPARRPTPDEGLATELGDPPPGRTRRTDPRVLGCCRMSDQAASPAAAFLVARNPQPESTLPYLLRLPLENGVVLKARESWPTTSRVYCHPFEDAWPEEAEIIEQTPVRSCRRRGAAIDLVLDRPRQGAQTMRIALPAGDYAVHAADETLLAAVERKSLDNLAATLSDGTLAFQMQRLAELPLAAVVVEARYSALYKLEHVNGSWLADQLARLEVRYPEVHVVFADSRRFAEEWTYRFLSSALADASGPSPDS